jgi:hypothetical protein
LDFLDFLRIFGIFGILECPSQYMYISLERSILDNNLPLTTQNTGTIHNTLSRRVE